ncbi:isochorismatase family cysteine hydrolase [Bacillus sp. FSL W7-1360]
MKALLVIDYTNDFIAEDGALPVGEPGRAIEQAIVSRIREFDAAKAMIVFATDVHEKNDANHPEAKLFPPHNIRGTKGRALFGEVGTLYDQIKDKNHVHWLDKTRYSAFVGTNLDLLLRENGVTEVHLTGDVTDICVLHTAIYAYSLGYKLVIYKDAVASFDPAGHEWALRHFKDVLGAEIR